MTTQRHPHCTETFSTAYVDLAFPPKVLLRRILLAKSFSTASTESPYLPARLDVYSSQVVSTFRVAKEEAVNSILVSTSSARSSAWVSTSNIGATSCSRTRHDRRDTTSDSRGGLSHNLPRCLQEAGTRPKTSTSHLRCDLRCSKGRTTSRLTELAAASLRVNRWPEERGHEK